MYNLAMDIWHKSSILDRLESAELVVREEERFQ